MAYDFTKMLSPAMQQLIQNISVCSKDQSALLSAATELYKSWNLNFPNWSSLDLAQKVSSISQSLSSILPSNIGTDLTVSVAETLTSLNLSNITADSISAMISSAQSVLKSLDTTEASTEYDYVELPESLVDITKQIDESILVEHADKDDVVRVHKADINVILAVLSLIFAIFTFFYTEHENALTTQTLNQQHIETLQQNHQFHQETLQQDQQQHEEAMQEERKQSELLKQIEKNTSNDNVSQSSAPTKPAQ